MKYARTDLIRTRLDKESQEKYRKLVLKSGKTSTEVAREAILFYIENHDRLDSKEFENTYRDDLKKSTNRICSLLAKVALDTATLAHFMHSTMDDVGKDQFKEAYSNAVKRVKARISKAEKEIVELLADDKD
ncbi:MAG: hypothetical protein K2X77_07120 [Candidatus Obscuribacterales bacterium]|jgi:predicted DNA-binding protein|nr:hypothetical protein [Candidatus Obscuribacterales bacterium]